jgi:hypothetical protein
LCSHSRISHLMEPENSLPCSKEPSTSPYPETDQSSLYHSIQSLKNPFHHYTPTYIMAFLVDSFPLVFPPISYMHCSSSLPCPSNLPSLYHCNYTWRSVQVLKFLVMQLSPTSSHFISLRSRYFPRCPVLKNSQSTFLA